jgi:hypothetical protein
MPPQRCQLAAGDTQNRAHTMRLQKTMDSSRSSRIHGELLKLGIAVGQAPVLPDLADVPRQSRRSDRGRRFLHRAHRHVPTANSVRPSFRRGPDRELGEGNSGRRSTPACPPCSAPSMTTIERVGCCARGPRSGSSGKFHDEAQRLDDMLMDGFQSLLRMMSVRNQDTPDSEFRCDVAVVCCIADKQRPGWIDADSLNQCAAGVHLSVRISI